MSSFDERLRVLMEAGTKPKEPEGDFDERLRSLMEIESSSKAKDFEFAPSRRPSFDITRELTYKDLPNVDRILYDEYYAKLGAVSPLVSEEIYEGMMLDGADKRSAARAAGLLYSEEHDQAYFPERIMNLEEGVADYINAEKPSRIDKVLKERMDFLREELPKTEDKGEVEKIKEELGKIMLTRQALGLMEMPEKEDIRKDTENLSSYYEASFKALDDVESHYRAHRPHAGMYISPTGEDYLIWKDERDMQRKEDPRGVYVHDLMSLSRIAHKETTSLLSRVDRGERMREGFFVPIGEFLVEAGLGIAKPYAGIIKAAGSMQYRASLKKFEERMDAIEKGELTYEDLDYEERMYINVMANAQNALLAYKDDIPLAADIAQGLGGLVGFAGEMALTWGIVSGIRAASTAVLTRFAARGGVRAFTAKTAGKLVQMAGVGTVQTAFMPRLLPGMLENYASGQSSFEAYANAYVDLWPDVFGSQLFTTSPMARARGGGMQTKTQQFWARANTVYGQVHDVRSALGSWLKMYSEEELVGISRAAIIAAKDGESFLENMMDSRERLVTAIVTGVPALAGYGKSQYQKGKVNLRIKSYGKKIAPIKAEIDAIFAQKDISTGEVIDAAMETLIEYNKIEGGNLSPQDVVQLADATINYVQSRIIQETWKWDAPNRDNPAFMDNKYQPLSEVPKDAETVTSEKDYVVKKDKSTNKEVIILRDKLIKIMNDFASEKPVSVEDMIYARNLLERIADKIEHKEHKNYFKSEAEKLSEVIDDMRPVKDMIQEAAQKPVLLVEPNAEPFHEVQNSERTDVYHLHVDGKHEGFGQRDVVGGKETFAVFDTKGKKLGVYKTTDAALEAVSKRAARRRRAEARKSPLERSHKVDFKATKAGTPQRMTVTTKDGERVGDMSAKRSKTYADHLEVEVKKGHEGIITDMFKMLSERLPARVKGFVLKKSEHIDDGDLVQVRKKLSKVFDITKLDNGDVLFTKKTEAPKFKTIGELGKALRSKAMQGDGIDPITALEAKRQVADYLASEVRRGKITTRQSNAILKAMARVDLANPVARSNFVAYAEKVMSKAENSALMADINSKRKMLRNRASKSKAPAPLKTLASELAKIDPVYIANLEAHLDLINSVLDSFKIPSEVKKGEKAGDVKTTEIVKVDPRMEAVRKMLKAQEKIIEANQREANKEMTGHEDISLRTLMEAADSLAPEVADEASKKARGKALTLLKTARVTINNMLKTSTDPITGDKIKIDDHVREVVKKFMDLEFEKLPTEQILEAYRSLEHFIVNQFIHGMEAVIEYDVGRKNLDKVIKAGIVAESFNTIIPLQRAIDDLAGEHIATLPIFAENIFRGADKAQQAMQLSGFTRFASESSRAIVMTNGIKKAYYKAFGKKKPNGEHFSTLRNVAERQVYATLKRHRPGTEAEIQAERNAKIEIMESSIEALRKQGTSGEARMADAYEQALNNRDSIDPINIEAVDFWINEWATISKPLSDLAAGLYNKDLIMEMFYTPTVYRFLKAKEVQLDKDGNIAESAFHNRTNYMPDRESTVLMETKNVQRRPADKYLSMDFDNNMARAMEGALMDLFTARQRMRIKGFMESSSFDMVFPDRQTGEIFKNRIFSYMRDAYHYGRPLMGNRAMSKAISVLQQYAATRSLGRVTMALQQASSAMSNTLLNTFAFDIRAMVDPVYTKFLDNSGYAIATRGVQSRGDMPTMKELSADPSNLNHLMKLSFKASNSYLQTFLINPDKAAARAAWITYYKKSLKKQGVNVRDIDWETHKIETKEHRKAADYAQNMVDKQLNVSDAKMMGEFLKDPHTASKAIRSTLFVFANFIMNQKMKFQTDVTVLTSRTASLEAKYTAMKSIGALAAEQAVFHTVGGLIRHWMTTLSYAIAGVEETYEENQARKWRRGKQVFEYVMLDFLSPAPFLDWMVAGFLRDSTYKVFDWFDIDISDDYVMRDYSSMDAHQMLGVPGILYNDLKNLYDSWDMALSKNYRTEFAGKSSKRYISSADRALMAAAGTMQLLHILGIAPADVKMTALGIKNAVNRRSVTKKGLEKLEKDHLKNLERARQRFTTSSSAAPGRAQSSVPTPSRADIPHKKR